jgi:hypothetical protein
VDLGAAGAFAGGFGGVLVFEGGGHVRNPGGGV